jgi:hypothetical protein
MMGTWFFVCVFDAAEALDVMEGGAKTLVSAIHVNLGMAF